MTTIDRFERVLPAALTDLADPRTPDYLADVLGQTADTRQRHAWASLERWLPMTTITATRQARVLPWRQIGLLAVLAIAILATVVAVAGSRSKPAPLFGVAAAGLIPYGVAGDLFAGDPLTGVSTALLVGPEFDFDPTYSRDGTRMLFARRVDPNDETVVAVYAMDVDGSNVRAVTGPMADPLWFDWTPDGNLVTVEGVAGAFDMFLYDVDGSEARLQLTEDIDVDVPSFRPPDGAEILFRGTVNDHFGLYVVNADGSSAKPRELIPRLQSSNGEYTLREPRYSPDGARIAFHQWDDKDSVMRLYVMDADGTNRRELGADPGIWFTGWPVWSNDGTRIAVQRGRVSADSDGFDLPYAIIDVESGTIIETGEPPACCRIEWAPDDSAILFLQDPDGEGPAPSRHILLDPAGGPSRELPWASDSFPTWQRKAD